MGTSLVVQWFKNPLGYAAHVGSIPGQGTKIPHSSEELSLRVGTVQFTGHNEKFGVTQWLSGSRQKINELKKKSHNMYSTRAENHPEWNTAWSGVLSFYPAAKNGRAKSQYSFVWHPLKLGFPGGLDSKTSACSAGKLGSIPFWEDPLRRKWQPTPVV